MKRIIALLIAALMLVAVAVPTFAADSKENPPIYEVKASSHDVNRGTVLEVVNADGTVTLTASSITNEFTKWVISGEYEIVSGSLTDKVITIRPLSNINAEAEFEGEKIERSPGTGTSTVAVLALLALLSMGVMAYTGKRICD